MKIAVVHNLPLGGMKRAMREQVKRLSKKHRMDIFTPENASYSYPPHFPKSVISIYKDLPKVYKTMADEINRGKYDVALVYPCFLTQAPYILRYLKCRSLYFCPEPKREFYEKIERATNFWTYWITYPFRIPIKEIDRFNTRCARKVVTISKYAKKQMDKIYGVDAKINYLAVDTDIFRPLTVKKENMVMTVGDLSLHKGHDFVIKSIAIIPDNIRPFLTIAGFGGSEKDYLLDLASRLEVKLIIKEKITDGELVDLYNKARLFLYAGINEPFGLVLLEAAACGLPVVAVDEGGVREIVRDRLMGALARRNLEEFSEKIMGYLGRSDEMVQERHDYVEKNWSWDKSVSKLEKYLAEVQ